MRTGNAVRYLMLLISLTCLLAGSWLQPGLVRLRSRYQLVSRPAREGIPPEYILMSAVLGGFRGLFLTTLWVRAQNMKNDGKYYEMVDIYNIITKLQPNHHSAWAFQSWDLAYNVSVEHDSAEDRVFWVFRGIDMLRRQGIPRNRNIPELCHELAWFFHHKIGQETDWANPWYRACLAGQVEYVFQDRIDSDTQTRYLIEMSVLPAEREGLFKDPSFAAAAERVAELGLDIFTDSGILFGHRSRPPEAESLMREEGMLDQVRRARLWLIADGIRQRLGMEPMEMHRLADRFGPIDWRTPYAHALYWSSRSYEKWLEQHPGDPTLKFERLVRFSMISLVHQGRLFQTEDGFCYYTPDYRLFWGVVKHLDEIREFFANFKKPDGSAVSMVGFVSGYSNFLRDAVFRSYFDGRHELARRIQAKLVEVHGGSQYRVSLQEFVKNNIRDWLDTPALKDSLIVLSGWLGTGYFYLAADDLPSYEQRNRLVEYFYREYCLKRWNPERPRPDDPDNRYTVPPLADIRRHVLTGIRLGMDSRFQPRLAELLWQRLKKIDPVLVDAVDFDIARIRQAQRQRQPLLGPEPPPGGGRQP